MSEPIRVRGTALKTLRGIGFTEHIVPVVRETRTIALEDFNRLERRDRIPGYLNSPF